MLSCALDPNSLKQALGNLLPLSATDTAYSAGCVRRHLDWLYGINLSRAFSVTSGQRTSIGRVKTRLLTELVKREREIKCFTPRNYFTATARFGDAVLEWQPGNGYGDRPNVPLDGDVTGICIAASEYRETLEPPTKTVRGRRDQLSAYRFDGNAGPWQSRILSTPCHYQYERCMP